MRRQALRTPISLFLALALSATSACDGGAKQGDKAATDEPEAATETFGSAELAAELADFPAQVDSLTWFGPGREIMVGWMRSVGFVKPECEEVYKAIERSYAVDLKDGGEIRVFIGAIDRAKVMACGKEAAGQGPLLDGRRGRGGEGRRRRGR